MSAWDEWIAREQTFQRDNLAASRTISADAVPRLTASGLGSVSRGLVDSARAMR